ncbi:dihydroorotase [Bartonella sp. HY406]|uniref:dihydroorotase n=1 Tax=Bartonella sp. HY406 TaxID=2979331 RepID=UPI0021C76679|nr:dihydroorotase [Bartonella sp. HY406]UXN04346.1 dihydroorotase [Bartonella sp. HY406]
MKTHVLKNAHVVDPSQNIDETGTIIIEDGKISAIGKSVQNQGVPEGAEIHDLDGKTIIPGLVDTRVFVGEPGQEYRETIRSASLAAASGGVTSFFMMPDTTPVIDDVSLVDFILKTARDNGLVRVFPTGSITKGMEGTEMAEIGLLKAAGAVAFTEGKKTIANANILRRAMTYARDFDVPIIHETQDRDLTGSGVMNSGILASWLGLSGIVREAELIALERDLRLAQLTKARYHAAQISCAMSADAVKLAKDRCNTISAGISINHLCLNENDIGEYRTFFRLSPPLRHEEDRLAMVEALRDGVIDIIVSSHDPQDADTKRLPFSDAEPGAIGLETLLAAALRLYHDGSVPLMRLIDALSTKPAQLFGLDVGTLKAGAKADLAIIDLEEPWVVKLDELHSRSKNTPFENARFQGRVVKTMVGGRFIFER